MLKIKTISKVIDHDLIEDVICNKCGESCNKENIKNSENFLSFDWLSVKKEWGYFSKKDLTMDEWHLCENCYDEFIASFKISPQSADTFPE